MEGISRRELASRHGISETAVRKHIANGNLAEALLPDGSLNPDIAATLLAGTIQKGRTVPVALRSAKNRRLRAQVSGLLDKVEEVRQSAVWAEDAKTIVDRQRERIVARLRRLPEDCKRAAGADPHTATNVLKAIVREVLEDLSQPAPSEKPVTAARPERPDLDAMTPNGLTALRINLLAEEMEMQQAIASGRARPVMAVVREWEEKLAVSKSLLVALPGRVAPFMEVFGAKARVRAEVEGIVASLS